MQNDVNLKKLEPCVYCLKKELMVYKGGSGLEEFHWVMCTKANCGAEGPMKRTIQQAIAVWNKVYRDCIGKKNEET